MANFDDIKMMLTSLLKSTPLNLGQDESSDDEHKADDGFDPTNPLANSDLYRDEEGNRLPSKLHVIPLIGKPILPTQITTIQLNLEWLDIITEVISSSHHTFAMFAVDKEKVKRNHMTLKGYPQTGTVVRLLSARSGPEEIDIVCEGVRRVSLIEVDDPKTYLAKVRYPEIEYRLANPTILDKLNANHQAIRDSLDRSFKFDKKIATLMQEQRDYARSIGIEVEKKTDTFEFDYFLYRDDKTIGRISKAKLECLFDYLGFKDLSAEQKEQIALALARPSEEELDKLNSYYAEAYKILQEQKKQLRSDLDTLAPQARDIGTSFGPEAQALMPEFLKKEYMGKDKASHDEKDEGASDSASLDKSQIIDAQIVSDDESKQESHEESVDESRLKSTASSSGTKMPKADDISKMLSSAKEQVKKLTQEGALKDGEINIVNTAVFVPTENGYEQVDDKNLNDIAKELASMLSAGALKKPRDEEDRNLLVGGSSSKRQAEIDAQAQEQADHISKEFISKLSDLLESKATDGSSGSASAQSKERSDLFAMIAKVGEQEEQETKKALADFGKAAFEGVLKNTPKESSDEGETITGPNIGFVNDDTAVVTFMPGRDSSEELLLRLTEIQKEHEARLRKEAAAASDDEDGNSEATTLDIVGDALNDDGSKETALVVSGSSRMNDDLKEFLNFLMQGKDLAEITSSMSEEDDEDDESADDESSEDSSSKTKGKGKGRKSKAKKSKSKGSVNGPSKKWGDLQRAAMIRSKLAAILGGKVVFGVSPINEKQEGAQREVEIRAYCLGITAALQELIALNPLAPEEMRQYIARFDMSNPSILADCAASITQSKPQELQNLLDIIPILPRLKLSFELVSRDLSASKLQDKIKVSVGEKIQKRQKDFFLREQLNEIKKELGLSADEKDLDVEKFKERMSKLNPPEHIKKRFDEEIEKLSMLETVSSEYGSTRNYIDILTSIPWGQMSEERLGKPNSKGKISKKQQSANALNLTRAREILDEDHEGLQDVKDRIIEFLAVGALKGQTAGQIMLFVGPPGVGKTSIGKSIAKALNRPFYRLSLGGIDDVSEIKGHRKTYVGAMPGKIVSALREAKVMNPVIMLDEIDKLGRSYHGDPDSALLETLDPEQNKNFLDVYLDEKLDLSNCLFICTANSTDTISAPLLDRMDPIRLSGYIAKEKFAIAKKHLIPRGLEQAGIDKDSDTISMPDECLTSLIEGYARESGVRSLERAIAKIIRKAAVKIVKGESKIVINEEDLETYLGTAPFKKEKLLQGIGIQTGLAWTASGGVTLPVESIVTSHDTAGFKLTGSLGDVMKESASIALSYVQSHLGNFCTAKQASFFKKKTIHLHVPEGAIPKDGPSAGVTMATSLLSLALNEAPKKDYAMTGELTLTGHVLPIGGLREKVIAARRMGIFNIIIPIGNEGDVKELPEHVRSKVTFYYADTYEDVAYTLFDSARTPLKRALKSYQPPRSVVFNEAGLSPEEQAKKDAEKKQAAKEKAKAPARKTASKAPAKQSSSTPAAPRSKSSKGSPVAKSPASKTTVSKASTSRTKSTATKAQASKTTASKAASTKAVSTAKAKTAATKQAPAKKATAVKSASSARKSPASTKAVVKKTTAKKAPAKKGTSSKK